MDSSKISADFTTLHDQAKTTAQAYFRYAIESIDREFGEGYSKKHPDLVAGYMQAAATDYNTNCLAKILQEGFEQVADKISEIGAE